MTRLQRLYDEQGQSPWLDNLTRIYLRDGTLGRLVADVMVMGGTDVDFARTLEALAERATAWTAPPR